MSDHVVTAHGNGTVFPYLVVFQEHQRQLLVDTLIDVPAVIRAEPRLHYSAFFYVEDKPVYDLGPDVLPGLCLRIGIHQGFGGAFLCDGIGRPDQDWAWIARAVEPSPDPPTVYFDQDGETEFPPDAVMPLDRLRTVVLEWVETGEAPRSVSWMPVNAMVWRLDDAGQPFVPSFGRRRSR